MSKHAGLVEDAPDSFTEDDLAAAKRVLAAILKNPVTLAPFDENNQEELQFLAGRIASLDPGARKRLRKARKKRRRERTRDEDEVLRRQSQIRKMRAEPVFVTPPGTSAQLPSPDGQERFHRSRICYVCKSNYDVAHTFYDQLCVSCGDLNQSKRAPSFDLSGRVALITGARVKIGYHAAILLLRNGCRVVVTTRFPNDCASRYQREPDFDTWCDRLEIYGLDLRHTPSVESLCTHLDQDLETLDFVIHNACQTVRRPPAFYAHMLEGERVASPVKQLTQKNSAWRARHSVVDSAALSQADVHSSPALPDSVSEMVEVFPAGALDADLQQIDLREHNSWRLKLEEVPTLELLEVLLVNAVAPFVISGRLRALMSRRRTGDKHIVNVSAMEGQFHRNKTDKHPHTNMAKAALNMLTRTSAQDYVRDGIHMNAVDTGWITDEDPAHIAQMKVEEHRFSPPLDVVDGAARIVDPIFSGLSSGKHVWGQFLKDYAPTYW